MTDDCIIYTKILSIKDVGILRTDLYRLGDWAEENEMKINLDKSKTLSFTRAREKDPLQYSTGDQRTPKASCCKYIRIIIRSDFSWADQVNYMVQKAWRALYFLCRL